MARRWLQSSFNVLRETLHGPIPQQLVPGRLAPSSAAIASRSDSPKRRLRVPGENRRYIRPDTLKGLYTHDPKTGRITKRRRSIPKAFEFDYAQELERLIFGIDNVEEDESFRDAVSHVKAEGALFNVRFKRTAARIALKCTASQIHGRIDHALADAECEEHGVYEATLEELVEEKWKAEEKIEHGFKELEKCAEGILDSIPIQRSDITIRQLPMSFREALRTWDRKRQITKERQSMQNEDELPHVIEEQLARKGWKGTPRYLKRLQDKRLQRLKRGTIFELAKTHERNALRRLCRFHAIVALPSVIDPQNAPPSTLEPQPSTPPPQHSLQMASLAKLPLDARWKKAQRIFSTMLFKYREVNERLDKNAYDEALKKKEAEEEGSLDVEAFNKKWFEDIAHRARVMENASKDFVLVRDEAMRAGLEPADYGDIFDVPHGEFEVHRDDGETDSERGEDLDPTSEAVEFAEDQRRIRNMGQWQSADVHVAKDEGAEGAGGLDMLEEVEIGESRSPTGLPKVGPDPLVHKLKIRQWQRKSDQNRIDADIHYERSRRRFAAP